jgi:tRNA A-37 threonylcarbamoyl transferase component Bud32
MPRSKRQAFHAPADAVTHSFKVVPEPTFRYELEERLHASATTSVWRARDTLTGDAVILKRLEPAAADDETARQRFDEEAATLARVTHPNAVPLLDRVAQDGAPALVFPYFPGRTLAVRLQEGPLPAPQAARIARDVSEVLEVAHAAGVVHRDVKPANVLLCDDGQSRLIDFGIARGVDGVDEARLELTGSGMAIGTLPYMAPEQLTGGQPSPAADIYALGAVLYEMLSGRRPYAGGSPAEQLALQQQAPDPIEGPGALTELTMDALDPLPENRPSATEFARALSAWLAAGVDTEGATAKVPVVLDATDHAPQQAGRRRAFAFAGLGSAVAAVLVIAAAFGNPVAPTDTPGPELDGIAVAPTASPAVESATPVAAVDPAPVVAPTRPTDPPAASAPDPTPNAQPPKHQGKDKHHHKKHHHHKRH